MKILVILFALFFSSLAQAAKITVPIDVGVGPSVLNWTGDLATDQQWHYGVSISAAAIIDKKTLKKHKNLLIKLVLIAWLLQLEQVMEHINLLNHLLEKY